MEVATTDKKRKAQEDQERLRKASTAKHFKLSPKNAAAVEALEVRWTRERQRLDGNYAPLSCECKFDRVIVTARKVDLDSFRALPGYRFGKLRRLRKKGRYKRAQPIYGTGSIREVVVEYDRRSWAPANTVTITPEDTGLAPEDLQLILDLLPDFKFSVLEVAWDFPSGSVMDVTYAKRFLLCGKMWLEPGLHPFHLKCGSPKGSMSMRWYIKWEIWSCRGELQLQRRFLREKAINHISDFQRLVALLIPGHIFFGRLDRDKLKSKLGRSVSSEQRRKNILDMAEDKSDESLWAALHYLGKKVGLKNSRRDLVVPLYQTNRVIRRALVKLLRTWPKELAGLESKE